MPRGARVLLDNALYHLITRGNQKQKVFIEDIDFEKYLKRLRQYKREFKFKLYGFCLMPNHIHLMGEIEQKENLAKFMQCLNSSYSVYFNSKYQKVGHLWQERFKSKVIVKDRHVLDCLNYIELNPVRANMIDTVYQYPWSSYKERNLAEDGNRKMLDELSLWGTGS